MLYTDTFKAIELDLLAWIQSDRVFGPRPGVCLEPGAIYSVFEAAVNKSLGVGADGKLGLGYVVQAIEEFVDEDVEVTFSALRLPIRIDITENVLLNRNKNRGTRIPLRAAAVYLQKMLKVYWAQNMTTDLVPDKPAIQIFSKHDDDNIRVARLFFHTYESDPIAFQDLAAPYLTPDHALGQPFPYYVTMAAAPGAVIYYTLDGSLPWPGQPANDATNFRGIFTSAQVYAGPVQVNGPCLLRARAMDPTGVNLGSKVSSINFTALNPIPPISVAGNPPQLLPLPIAPQYVGGIWEWFNPDTNAYHGIYVLGQPPQLFVTDAGEAPPQFGTPRYQPNVGWQWFNATTGLWHTVYVAGAPPQIFVSI